MDKVLFSSDKTTWRTPPSLFEELNKEFHFTLDAAADDSNHLCDYYFTQEEDGLTKDWTVPEGTAVFVNPPYGRKLTSDWVKKAYQEAQKGIKIVMLIPSRTETIWFHEYIYHKAEIRFIKGRIHFLDENGNVGGAAPFPSMLVIYN